MATPMLFCGQPALNTLGWVFRELVVLPGLDLALQAFDYVVHGSYS